MASLTTSHRRTLGLMLALLVAPVLAHADASALAGTYTKSSHGSGAQVVVKPLDATHAKVSIDVGAAGCAGQVEGTGTVAGNTVHLRVPSTMATDGMCSIDLVFSGSRIKISEDSCLEFHGASCDFTETGSGAFHRKAR